MSALRRSLAVAAVIATIAVWPVAPAAAHPLGNFTVNVYAGIVVRPRMVVVDYVIDMAEIPAFGARRQIDGNLDERIDERESLAYRDATCDELAGGITLVVGDQSATVEASDWHRLTFPGGAGGLPTLRLECRLSASTPAIGAPVALSFADGNHADAIGWREVTAVGDGVTLEDSDVPAVSESDRLADYPEAEVPLDTRVATFTARSGGPELAAMPWPGDRATAGAIAARDAGALGDFVAKDLTPLLVATMVAIAFGVGAVHALGPGHGKTVIGAYLIGTAGSMRDAVGVGAAVSIMHTASVLTLGLLVLSVERMLAPERIYPLLGLASGVIALGLGSALLWSRIGAARSERRHHGDDHPHPHSHDGGGASPVSRRGLAALALSGGLLPSPSALVTLLAAVSVGRTTLGVLLIAAFSIGLAASLIGVGIVSLRAKDVAERRLTSRVAGLLPIASSAAIVATGVFLMVRGAAQL